MLTLSINSQNHFGSPALSPSSSPTSSSRPSSQPALKPPSLMNPSKPRRSMMPQGLGRPKLSLQTAILPQPVTPALPLPCSADTPTSRNTLANSFRSPGPETKSIQLPESPRRTRESTPIPYGVEKAKGGILKNTPLAKLIRSRQVERRRNIIKAGISFVEEPQLIPRPPQDADIEMDEDTNETTTDNVFKITSDIQALTPSTPSALDDAEQSQPQTQTRTRSNSIEWKRLRTRRAANEGRELRRPSISTPITTTNTSTSTSTTTPASPASSTSSLTSSPILPPQTPETPSPAQTRDWVWTLGDDFHTRHANTDWAPYTPPDSSDSSRRSSATTDAPGARAQKIGVNGGGRMPDTPSTSNATPVTPAGVRLPETPVSATDGGDGGTGV